MTARRVPLSPGRQTVADLSWASLRVPRCAMMARLALPRAQAARAAMPAPRIPWTVIFAKGFALAAEAQPALRRIHATLPRPHLIEAPHAIGCIVLERAEAEGQMLGLARFTEPHARPLPDLARALRHAKDAPAAEVKTHRRVLRFARLPWPLRRLMLRWALAAGAPLLRYGGTFAVSAVGHRGAAVIDSVSVLPCFLSYGPIGAAGEVEAFLSFDHRVMDGGDGAAALRGLEAAIEGPVAAEIEALSAAG
ncbi:hypothetical protein [Falsiroseomonas sp. CW058]|uniref:hypothetical protein n=1 Tax=Falsiroseomonas sp. CW058 TaxID=3388664 RepID=UPI003D314D68